MIAVSESAHAPGRRAAEEEGPAAVAGVQKARVVEGREHGFHFFSVALRPCLNVAAMAPASSGWVADNSTAIW